MHFHKYLKLTAFLVAVIFTLICCGGETPDAPQSAEKQAKPGLKKSLAKNDLPAPVRATLEKESAGCTVEEIEKETEDGKVEYEIEIDCNGKEYELEIAADGKLLEKEAEEDDEDEDDDDGDDEKDDD
jgi:uncharacterized membrane protein YkoI